MAFERIIRPFESGSPFNSRKLPPVETAEPMEPAALTWGKGLSVEYTPYQNTFRGWVYEESSNVVKSKTVRVYQNNDSNSSNWVDVERAEELLTRNNEGEQVRQKIIWPDEGAS